MPSAIRFTRISKSTEVPCSEAFSGIQNRDTISMGRLVKICAASKANIRDITIPFSALCVRGSGTLHHLHEIFVNPAVFGEFGMKRCCQQFSLSNQDREAGALSQNLYIAGDLGDTRRANVNHLHRAPRKLRLSIL